MQIRSGQAMIEVGLPRRVQFSGMSVGDAALLSSGQLFKFEGESPTYWFTVAAIVSVVPPVEIELTDDYTGTHTAGVLADYLICRDFTPLFALPELSPSDVDIRETYTKAVRLIDTELARGIVASGVASVTASDTTLTVLGAFPPPPYGVLVTPSWLTTVRVRNDVTKTAGQWVADFGTSAPASSVITWAVLG